MKKISIILMLVVMISSFGTIANAAEGTNSISKIESSGLTVNENDVTIEMSGASAFVDVMFKDSEGEDVNVNTLVEWKTDNQDVAIAYDGRILATGKGKTTVTVTYGEYIEKIKIQVNKDLDITALEEEISKNELRVSSERDNIYSRASAMYNTTWVPEQNLVGWRELFSFTPGNVYRIPYSQTEYQCNKAGFENALDYSDFYATYYRFNIRMPKYGNDCSGFVSFCWNIYRHTTSSFLDGLYNGEFSEVGSYDAEDPDYYDLLDSYELLQKGDAVITEGHTFLIAGNFPGSDWVACYEQTPYQLQYTFWDYSDLANYNYRPFTNQ